MEIYLDYHSTSPVDKRVAEAMLPFFSERFGNPASAHRFGEDAARAIEHAKKQVASIIKAKSDNIYFTNSATEANNIILNSWWGDDLNEWRSLFTTNTEHSSVVKSIDNAPDNAYIVYFKINKEGNISLKELESRLKSYASCESVLVSIIAANNEIGTIHDLKKIGALCKKYGALFHTDATQAIGKIDIDVDEMNIFALTMSGHKIYGPKGVGALYVRDISKIKPIIHGGYQNIVTSGTQNVPAIVGIGKACEILEKEGKEENKRIKKLRNKLWNIIHKELPDVFINGTMKNRLPNNLNITIKGIKAEILVKGLDDVIISGGSACTSGDLEPSHVIEALGTPYPDCAIRFGLGRWTTDEDINYAADRIIGTVNAIRSSQNAEED